MMLMKIQKKMKEFINIRKSCYNRRREEDFGISGNNEFRHWKHCQKNQQIWRSIYEVILDDYSKVVKLIPSGFLN